MRVPTVAELLAEALPAHALRFRWKCGLCKEECIGDSLTLAQLMVLSPDPAEFLRQEQRLFAELLQEEIIEHLQTHSGGDADGQRN